MIRIRNHKPATLYTKPFDLLPNSNANKSIDDYTLDMDEDIKNNYVKPMFEPINPNTTVSIEDLSGKTPKTITKEMLFDSIIHLWTSNIQEVELQDQLGEIFRQGIQFHTQNDWYFEEQLGIEALTRSKLPPPSQKSGRIVQYSPSVDIIPAAKQLLAQQDEDSATAWFANLVGLIHNRPFNNFLLLTVESSSEFDNFKQHLKNFIQVWQANTPLDQTVNKLLAEFDKVNLIDNLSTGLFLPNGGLSNPIEHGELSFTRILTYTLSQYEKTNPGKLTTQPINLKQVYFPENIIILNLENYAHAKASDIKKDWDALERAFLAKKTLNLITNKKLLTAQAIDRNLSNPTKTSSNSSQGQPALRSRIKHLSGKPIPSKDMLKMMKRVIESQITNKISENTYKIQKTSYMRPNRRRPDDINLPGVLKTTKYRPDIHIYLDTSGSISETQYRDSITNLIMLAKSINCNLFFTSFSHVISQTSLLQTKDQSIKNIYKTFQKTPKVAGGTDFEQVWRKIDVLNENNKKTNKSHQINFIITDFGYNLRSGKRWDINQASLKHTFYVPISVDKNSWPYILKYGKDFIKGMAKAGDYGIRKRLLM